MREFKTKDIKLAALILAKIPSASFHIETDSTYPKKVISISLPISFQKTVDDLLANFINCESTVNLYEYNLKLNLIRDQLKGGRNGQRTE